MPADEVMLQRPYRMQSSVDCSAEETPESPRTELSVGQDDGIAAVNVWIPERSIPAAKGWADEIVRWIELILAIPGIRSIQSKPRRAQYQPEQDQTNDGPCRRQPRFRRDGLIC